MIRALVALFVTLPLAAALTERPASDVRTGLASATAPGPTITASNGQQMLVAWESLVRDGQVLLVDAHGQPLTETPVGIPLHNPIGAFWRDGSWTIVSDYWWVRVSEDGTLLDPVPNRLMLPRGTALGAAWTGDALIVLVQQDEALLAVTFDSSSLLPRETREIAKQASNVRFASDGDSALLVFRAQNAMRAVAFSKSGALDRERSIDIPFTPVAIGTRGEDYVVLATDDAQPRFNGFSILRFDALLDFRTLGRFAEGNGIHAMSNVVSWDGAAFTYVYAADAFEGAFIRAARFGANGALAEDAPVAPMGNYVPRPGSLASAGAMGTTILLRLTRDADHAPFALQLRAGRFGADIPLERGALQQINPAVASSAAEALVVWQERLAYASYRVYGTRVDARGRVLDPQSLDLGTTTPYTRIAVASNGTDYLLAWHEADGIRVTHVRADGSVAATSLVTRVGNDAPQVGELLLLSNGTDYLLAWTQQQTVYAKRIHADGGVSAAPPSEVGNGYSLSGASDGRDYLVLADFSEAHLVSGSDARVLARVALAGFGSLGVWWDGTAYNIVQVDNSALRVNRVTREGTTTASERTSHWPPMALTPGATEAVCDRTGCSRIEPAIENGRSYLREVRVSAEPSARLGHKAEIAPLMVVERYDSLANGPHLVPFRVQGRLFAAFARPKSEAPYAGIRRLFVVPMQELSRTRAVRH